MRVALLEEKNRIGPKIPIGFWPEAVRMAVFLKNRSLHKAIKCTPYEA